MADPMQPSASCLQAHTQQIANNTLFAIEERTAGLITERELTGAVGRLQVAEQAYERTFGLAARTAAQAPVVGGYFAPGAKGAYDALVAPRLDQVQSLTRQLVRHNATAAEIERITQGIVERGPQRTGECSRVNPAPGLGDDLPTGTPPRGLKAGQHEA